MKVGILGARWGRTHVGTFRRAGADVAVIVSADPERSERVAREERIRSGRLEDLDGVDVVVVATPWSMHREHVLRWAAKSIFCEKPLLGCAPDAEFRARARDLDLHVSYAFPFLPFAPALARAIAGAPSFDLDVRVALPDVRDAKTALREVAVHPIAYLVHVFGDLRAERVVVVNETDRVEIEVGGARRGRVVARVGGDPGFVFSLAAGSSRLRGGYTPGAGWGFDGHGPPRNDAWYEANCALVETYVARISGRIDATDARARGLLRGCEALAVEDVIGPALGRSEVR